MRMKIKSAFKSVVKFLKGVFDNIIPRIDEKVVEFIKETIKRGADHFGTFLSLVAFGLETMVFSPIAGQTKRFMRGFGVAFLYTNPDNSIKGIIGKIIGAAALLYLASVFDIVDIGLVVYGIVAFIISLAYLFNDKKYLPKYKKYHRGKVSYMKPSTYGEFSWGAN